MFHQFGNFRIFKLAVNQSSVYNDVDRLERKGDYLIQNAGQVISKQELFEKVWENKFTGDGTLNVHIRKIREAIEEELGTPNTFLPFGGTATGLRGKIHEKPHLFGSMIALPLIELAVLLLFALPKEENLQDTVTVNEIVQAVQNGWDSLEGHTNCTDLDYVVVRRNSRTEWQKRQKGIDLLVLFLIIWILKPVNRKVLVDDKMTYTGKSDSTFRLNRGLCGDTILRTMGIGRFWKQERLPKSNG